MTSVLTRDRELETAAEPVLVRRGPTDKASTTGPAAGRRGSAWRAGSSCRSPARRSTWSTCGGCSRSRPATRPRTGDRPTAGEAGRVLTPGVHRPGPPRRDGAVFVRADDDVVTPPRVRRGFGELPVSGTGESPADRRGNSTSGHQGRSNASSRGEDVVDLVSDVALRAGDLEAAHALRNVACVGERLRGPAELGEGGRGAQPVGVAPRRRGGGRLTSGRSDAAARRQGGSDRFRRARRRLLRHPLQAFQRRRWRSQLWRFELSAP